MAKKLFVGNLSYGTSDSDLRELFSTVGTCVSATVLTDRVTSRSRGFGFVEMGSDDEAERAIAQLNGNELQGRKISVSEARERTGPGPNRNPGYPPRSFGRDLPPRPQGRKSGGSRRGLRAKKRSL